MVWRRKLGHARFLGYIVSFFPRREGIHFLTQTEFFIVVERFYYSSAFLYFSSLMILATRIGLSVEIALGHNWHR